MRPSLLSLYPYLSYKIQLKTFLYAFALFAFTFITFCVHDLPPILDDSLIIPLCVLVLVIQGYSFNLFLVLKYFSDDKLVCVHLLLQSLSLLLTFHFIQHSRTSLANSLCVTQFAIVFVPRFLLMHLSFLSET